MLVYDGKQITFSIPHSMRLYVTALAGNESDLWVGTLNRGVLHFHAGQTDSFAEAQGLPDPQVQSLAISGDTTYVGTRRAWRSSTVAAFLACSLPECWPRRCSPRPRSFMSDRKIRA